VGYDSVTRFLMKESGYAGLIRSRMCAASVMSRVVGLFEGQCGSQKK
jgi:hypothetical protein